MLKNLLVLMFRRNISWVENRQSAVARSVGTFGAQNNFFAPCVPLERQHT